MWLLECDGDLFSGKRKWLKPGQKYLFGRTKGDAQLGEQSYAINNKSVSRKHLVIAIAPVERGQGDHLYEKSKLTVTDESKLGTHVDGEKIVNESRTLSDKLHSIKLGSYNQTFRISWHPVVFTFSYSLKEQQRSTDILAPFRDRLEPFDIKTILPYSIIDTTHVVASKRNIPKCLQALINARNIVKESYVDALVRLCQPGGVLDDGKTPLPSPLEEDFDANWPDSLSYLPDAGKEPVPRPSELYMPDHERINTFENFTFVFADTTQYEQLSPVLTNGGAKAVKYDLKLGQSSVADFVQFIRNVADHRGIRDLADNETGKKVVVVRFRGKGDTEQWADDFIENLDSELGQRCVEQNEFLDTILMNDASSLWKRLEVANNVLGARERVTTNGEQQNGTAVTTNTGDIQEHHPKSPLEPEKAPEKSSPSSETKPAPSRSRFRRAITESRFKGFDDFDPSQLPKSNKNRRDSVEDENDEESTEQHEMEVDSQPLFVSDSQPSTRSKKRPAAQDDDEDAGAAMFENLLPGAAAMKRRRLEEQRAGRVTLSADQSSESATQPKQPTSKAAAAAAKKRKEIDVRSEARSHAKKLDEQRSPRLPSESRGEDASAGMDADEDISQLRNLAIIEDMAVPERPRPSHAQTMQNGDGDGDADAPNPRWDPRWNGLKNFKKFRRQGASAESQPNRGRRTLVGLEEVKRKDYGIGDNYWLEPSSSSKREKRGRPARAREQTQATAEVHEQQDEEEILPDEVAGEPREGPVADALAEQQQRQQQQLQSQADAGTAKGRGKGKRGAAAAAVAKTPTPKRQRQTRNTSQAVRDESSDEDELKFRLRSRRG